MHHRTTIRTCIVAVLVMATFAYAQPAFLNSFPDLNELRVHEGNSLYYPAAAELEEVSTLSSSPSTVLRLEQGTEDNPKTYVVRASLHDDSEQLRWTVLYNTSNISHSLDISAHTLVLPANGNLYSIETVKLDAPLALDSLEVQHKYVLQGDVLQETPQPFFYIGQATTTSDFITLMSQPVGGERIAGVAANSPVTILSLSITAEGAYVLVASPFGLAGWLPVQLELAQNSTYYLAELHELMPTTVASMLADSDSAPLPATEERIPVGTVAAPVPAGVTPPPQAAVASQSPPSKKLITLAQNAIYTNEAVEDTALFTVENATGERWLGFSRQQDSDLDWMLDVRLDVEVAEVLLADEPLVQADEVVGYVSYAPSYPCTSELRYRGRTGKKLELKEILITGQDTCLNHGTVYLSSQEEGRIMWRYYRPDGHFDSDAILRIAPVLEPEHSLARHWNEALLSAIRQDFARPTVHARNLFHTSVALYDAWAVFDASAEPFLLGNTVGDFHCDFAGFTPPEDVATVALQEEAMSYAAYRLLEHRFSGMATTEANRENRPFYGYLLALGYEPFESSDYSNGSVAALGNHIGDCLIAFGLQDGANEADLYANRRYQPKNMPFVVGNVGIEQIDPNHWQPLSFVVGGFIDQGGNSADNTTPTFLGAEWGNVIPFALDTETRQELTRNGERYYLYHDPGKPPYLGSNDAFYQWGFALVAAWSAQLDPADDVMIDISPASLGNLPVEEYPTTLEQYQAFYNIHTGDDPSHGYDVNPRTGQPYQPQVVRRGDYTRILAEFWADGPDSETPPGHWFTVANYVSDHPDFVPRFHGEGEVLSQLEWDVKTYFTLGGAVHDAAISAWAVKGWYDYVRPISAIRYMASKGQSSDPNLPNYSPQGIPLVKGLIELIGEDDPLVEVYGQSYIGDIKLKAWRGHMFSAPSQVAGVDWILASQWMPYQRETFVTPPFAGYVSGHSTFSRAAAEVLTLLTGDPFFPGGMGEFYAPKNDFLVFEQGPSEDIVLQWATYRDASDQTSLSRIWGGIHPPADDIPGRLIGLQVGQEAFARAVEYFDGTVDN